MERFYTKEEVCIGCRLCEVFCVVQHSRSKDVVKAYKKESPSPPRLKVEVRDAFSFATVCQHCEEPLCVYSCFTGALSKDPVTGLVLVDEERCVGCWTCVLACPLAAVYPNGGKVIKCDYCLPSQKPACLVNCPNAALVYFDAHEPD